jgi:hypothetical protein
VSAVAIRWPIFSRLILLILVAALKQMRRPTTAWSPLNRARLADWLLIAWLMLGGIFFFRQFWDTAIPYLARLAR